MSAAIKNRMRNASDVEQNTSQEESWIKIQKMSQRTKNLTKKTLKKLFETGKSETQSPISASEQKLPSKQRSFV